MEQIPQSPLSSAEEKGRVDRGDNGLAPSALEREDIRRIEVDDEDRLAFRVGVHLITLALLGFALWRLIVFLRG